MASLRRRLEECKVCDQLCNELMCTPPRSLTEASEQQLVQLKTEIRSRLKKQNVSVVRSFAIDRKHHPP